MNGSSPQTFSKSLQKPANLAMMASMVAHGFLFTGLALVPATGQQNAKKSLRVVSLLQPSPEQPGQPQQPVDPNAPPPAPGVAGLPFNITTPGDLPELSTTNTPNAAFDPFASSVVELPDPQPTVPNPAVNSEPKSLARPVPPAIANPAKPSNPDAPTLSDQDFQDWLNGTDDLLLVFDDPGSSVPSNQSQTLPDSAVQPNISPNAANPEGISNPSDSNPLPQDLERDPFKKPLAPPGQVIERRVAYNYPQAACEDRLEGKAEYRIWVSAQAKPVVSGIVVSSNSDILDRAVKAEARKYKITAADADKLVTLPFDFKYSEKVCAVQKPSTQPDVAPTVPTPIPSPGPNTDEPPEPTLDDQNGQQPSPSPTPSNPIVPPTQNVQPNPGSTPTEPTLPTMITPSQPSPPLSTPLPSPKPVEPAPIAPTAPAVPKTTPPKSLKIPAAPVPSPVPAAPIPAPAAPISPPAGTSAPIEPPAQPDATTPASPQPIPPPAAEGSQVN